MGTLAVYGFLTAYGLVAVALFFHRVKPDGFRLEGNDQVPQGFSLGSHNPPKRWGALAPGERRGVIGTILLTSAAALAMLLAMLSNLYPVPPSPVRYFPYIYAAYLAIALLWLLIAKPRKDAN
jgi:amino acid transporter